MPDLEQFRHQPELWQDLKALEDTALQFINEDKLVLASMFLAFVGIKARRELELNLGDRRELGLETHP